MYRILVVEDDEVIAKTIRQHLQSWNYEVFAVVDFNSVMEEFARVKPHLVLMDITMPEMDGIQALKKIKEQDPGATVIMCSAMGQQAMVIESIQSGAKDFIVKPFQQDRVLEAVRKVVG